MHPWKPLIVLPWLHTYWSHSATKSCSSLESPPEGARHAVLAAPSSSAGSIHLQQFLSGRNRTRRPHPPYSLSAPRDLAPPRGHSNQKRETFRVDSGHQGDETVHTSDPQVRALQTCCRTQPEQWDERVGRKGRILRVIKSNGPFTGIKKFLSETGSQPLSPGWPQILSGPPASAYKCCDYSCVLPHWSKYLNI